MVKNKEIFLFPLFIIAFFLSFVFFDFQLYENKANYSINIRQAPSTKSKVVASLSSQKTVFQIKQKQDWSSVIHKKYGFIYNPLLSKKQILVFETNINNKTFFSFLLGALLVVIIYFPIILFRFISQKLQEKKDEFSQKLQEIENEFSQKLQEKIEKEFSRKLQEKEKEFSQKLQDKEKEVIKLQNKLSESEKKVIELQNKLSESEKKGRNFENYVVGKIDKTLEFIRWRSDKCIASSKSVIYPSDSLYPDLLISYTNQSDEKQKFAIECKWRKKWWEKIEKEREKQEGFLLECKQLENYAEYAAKNSIPVFLVIGIGGNSKKIYDSKAEEIKPDELFIISLDDFEKISCGHNYKSVEYKFINTKKLEKYDISDFEENFFFITPKILKNLL